VIHETNAITVTISFTANAPWVEFTLAEHSTDFVSESTLDSNNVVEAAFTTESATRAYQPSIASFTTQTTLYAKSSGRTVEFGTQSVVNAYVSEQADFITENSFAAFTEKQTELATESALYALQVREGAFTTEAFLERGYTNAHEAVFDTQSTLHAYVQSQSVFATQTDLVIYRSSGTVYITESVLAGFSEWLNRFVAQSATEAFEPKQVAFVTESALTGLLERWQAFYAQSGLLSYQTVQGQFVTESALVTISANLAAFIAESGLVTYTSQRGAFTTQAALDAVDQYYAWAINLETGAVSQFTNYAFNSLSGGLGANETGVFELFGSDDDGVPIAGYVETGNMDFGESMLKRVTDYYVNRVGGALRLTVEAENATTRYAIPASAIQRNTKVDLAKGAKGRRWKFRLANANGSAAVIEEQEFVVIPLSRRI
jgi:hypothetical protein